MDMPHYRWIKDVVWKAYSKFDGIPDFRRAWDQTYMWMNGRNLNQGEFFSEDSPLKKATRSANAIIAARGIKNHIFDVGPDVWTETFFALNFESAGRHIIKPSLELCHALMTTEPTMPMSHLRLPFPCIYIDIPEGARIDWLGDDLVKCGELRAMYALELSGKNIRTPIGTIDHGIFLGCVRHLTVKTNGLGPLDEFEVKYSILEHYGDRDDRLLTDIMGDMEREVKGLKPNLPDVAIDSGKRLHNLFFNLILFLSNPELCGRTRVEHPLLARLSRAEGDSASRIPIMWQIVKCPQAVDTLSVGEGFTSTQQERDGAAEQMSGARTTVRTHWRRGHWRGVWQGSASDRKLVPHWIRATIVNAGITTTPEGTSHI